MTTLKYWRIGAAAVFGGILIIVAKNAQGQVDSFNSMGKSATVATCEANSKASIKQIRQDETSANIQYTEANRRCNALGSAGASCFSELRKRVSRETVGFMSRSIDADATRQICVLHAKLQGNSTCEQRYQIRLIEENILYQSALKKANLICNLGASAKSCIDQEKQRLSDWFGTQETPGKIQAATERTVCESPDGLPPGAVPPGKNPGALEYGPGIIGSFPNTKSSWDFCYTYCSSKLNRLPVIGFSHSDPTHDGKSLNDLKPGDVLVFFKKSVGSDGKVDYIPVHYALYKGNGTVWFKNGASDVYIAKLPDYLKNYEGFVVRAY